VILRFIAGEDTRGGERLFGYGLFWEGARSTDDKEERVWERRARGDTILYIRIPPHTNIAQYAIN